MADDAEKTVKEIMDELLPALEAMEARSAAIVQFLKEEGMATDDQLSRYLQPAEDASNVRWRAARIRLERLFSSALASIQKAAEDGAKKTGESAKEKENKEKSSRESSGRKPAGSDEAKGTKPAQSDEATGKRPAESKKKPVVKETDQEDSAEAKRDVSKDHTRDESGPKPTAAEAKGKATATKPEKELTGNAEQSDTKNSATPADSAAKDAA